jgi:hypothetical protein
MGGACINLVRGHCDFKIIFCSKAGGRLSFEFRIGSFDLEANRHPGKARLIAVCKGKRDARIQQTLEPNLAAQILPRI